MRGPNGERRSGNPIARAVQVGRIATGEERDAKIPSEKLHDTLMVSVQAGSRTKEEAGRMGTFDVDLWVGRYDAENPIPAEELKLVTPMVDTGATHTVLPSSVLNELGVAPFDEPIEVTFADGQRGVRRWGLARLVHECEGRRYDVPCYVIFGDADVELMGATTLEAFGLVVDSVAEKLVPRVLYARPF